MVLLHWWQCAGREHKSYRHYIRSSRHRSCVVDWRIATVTIDHIEWRKSCPCARTAGFSADEYHHHDHGSEQDPNVTESDTVTTAWLTDGATSNRRSWTSSYLGGASRCWSCTATDRETDDDDNGNGNDNNVNAEEEHCRRTSKRQLSWFRKLNRKFRNSRDSQ